MSKKYNVDTSNGEQLDKTNTSQYNPKEVLKEQEKKIHLNTRLAERQYAKRLKDKFWKHILLILLCYENKSCCQDFKTFSVITDVADE